MKEEYTVKAYLKSITRELVDTKNRVRNLIQTRHWGEDGRHKESILKNVLRRHVPSNITVGTGFIIKVNQEKKMDSAQAVNMDFEKLLNVSTQIDVLMFDNSFPVLFQDGDFYIIDANAVRGMIEVKTEFENELDMETTIADLKEMIFNRHKEVSRVDHLDENGKNKKSNLKKVVSAFIESIKPDYIEEDRNEMKITLETKFSNPKSKALSMKKIWNWIKGSNWNFPETEGYTGLEEIIRKANRNGSLVPPNNKIFNGVLFFDCDKIEDIIKNVNKQKELQDLILKFSDIIKKLKSVEDENTDGNLVIKTMENNFVNHLSIGEHLFAKYWPKRTQGNEEKDVVNFYFLEDLGFTFFINNFINDISLENKDIRSTKVMHQPELLFGDGKKNFLVTSIELT